MRGGGGQLNRNKNTKKGHRGVEIRAVEEVETGWVYVW